jgi:hypothetical protein
MKRRKLLLAFAVATGGIGLIAPVTPSVAGGASGAGAPDTFVAAWDAVGTQAFSAAALSPAEGHTIFGYMSIAVYDAVMAIEGGYEPFAVEVDGPAGASPQAAVAAAAHGVLAHYLPAQRATIIDPALVTSLATIQDGQAKNDGVTVGEQVAAQLIELRADDGFRDPVTYTPPNPPIPGVWLPTSTTPPIGPYLGLMDPLSLDSAGQFRPAGPPPLRSRRWAREYNEVKEIGSATSTTRTAEQTVAARFWGEAPVQQARGSFRKFILDHRLDIVDAARFNAMVSVSVADSLIACFDAKYHYKFWRPITAVRAGDTDGNPATVGDPAWMTLLAGTPNHPEYPSAHSCITPLQGRIIARFLGTARINFTVPSLTGLGDRTFAKPIDLQNEVGNARIWGGIHYRTSVNHAIVMGRHVMNWVLDHHFRPTS